MARQKVVRFFRLRQASAAVSDDLATLIGAKAVALHRAAVAKLPVPPGFVVTTQVAREFFAAGQTLSPVILSELKKQMTWLDAQARRMLGRHRGPTTMAVRLSPLSSGRGLARSILNIGLNEKTTLHLWRAFRDPAFAHDCHRRLRADFAEQLDCQVVPDAPIDQLVAAISGCFKSWLSPRATADRKARGISDEPALAVIVQAMVHGNLGDTSAAGTAFTHDPATGQRSLRGEFLVNAQGPDLLAGQRSPMTIDQLPRWHARASSVLDQTALALEKCAADAQDFEFVFEQGRLFVLRTQNSNRSAVAQMRIAVEQVKRKIIDRKTALLRVDPESLDAFLHPVLDPKAVRKVIARGVPASPGAAVGKLAFSAAEAQLRAGAGETVILVCHETSPEDIAGMQSAVGILTSTGGMTSHAAVVARGWGKCCVAGAGSLNIDVRRRRVEIDGVFYGQNDHLSIDGTSGEVIEGQVGTVEPQMTGPFATIMDWASEYCTMQVHANADRPEDARVARHFGASGIGLCRTEHMFFDPMRIGIVRQMILAGDVASRRAALAQLLPFQRDDFVAIFKVMEGLPVTVRLLDPPLHEFLPKSEKAIRTLAGAMNVPFERLRMRVRQLHEINPMLGHRGVRLSITYPEILQMQVRAILEAACECQAQKIKTAPEIMIPLVGTRAEIEFCRKLVDETAQKVFGERKQRINYRLGTMIEVPRAALVADQLAHAVEFFSFGTNDLTQLTFGYSRDDSASFLPQYMRQRILETDPFHTLDKNGVGALIEASIHRGRSVRSDLKCGICGEHAGESRSVRLCYELGLDYVSCSPYRVPIARLASAQAAILATQRKPKRR